MKSISVTSSILGLVFLISIGLLDANAEIYKDEQQGFSINYPNGWYIENEFYSQDGVDYLVTFYDNIDGWSVMLDVRHFPNSSMMPESFKIIPIEAALSRQT